MSNTAKTKAVQATRGGQLNSILGGRRTLRRLGKVALFLISVFLFILAISLMKEGASAIGPVIRDRFALTNAANSLGFGWLFSYAVMSGSPVAAAALTFFDAGIIDRMGAFAMITGSRLGASFIVLFLGFIYVLRGRSRSTSLSIGLLSLIVTGSTYLAGFAVGVLLLNSGWLDAVHLDFGAALNSVTEVILDPVANFLLSVLPRWSLFLVGLGIIVVSFKLFDKSVPAVSGNENQLMRIAQMIYRPWVMLLLGAAFTLITMSVSVSLGILVPLSQRGLVRRENVIPYIMGANITTFIDTLLAAVLLNNPPAFNIVLVEMVSITIVSIFILALIYRPYHELMLHAVDWIALNNRHLALFMLTILVVPLILLVL